MKPRQQAIIIRLRMHAIELNIISGVMDVPWRLGVNNVSVYHIRRNECAVKTGCWIMRQDKVPWFHLCRIELRERRDGSSWLCVYGVCKWRVLLGYENCVKWMCFTYLDNISSWERYLFNIQQYSDWNASHPHHDWVYNAYC